MWITCHFPFWNKRQKEITEDAQKILHSKIPFVRCVISSISQVPSKMNFIKDDLFYGVSKVWVISSSDSQMPSSMLDNDFVIVDDALNQWYLEHILFRDYKLCSLLLTNANLSVWSKVNFIIVMDDDWGALSFANIQWVD